ncbi:MAG: glyoxalase/bleomycin resistance/extradiol dioxygenase family protein [Acidobacteria bacterium]|nr:glyoxalase/bleomycin resistance/extradiol dioxygenase family protein [Acidobacteriota bacterium]
MGITPYLGFKGNCREAIAFYQSAIGAELTFLQTFGESPMPEMGPAANIMHADLKIGDSHIMMSDDMRPDTPAAGGNISLALRLDDTAKAAQHFDNLAQGGAVLMPLAKTYWAESFGMLKDKFGITWMVNCETR